MRSSILISILLPFSTFAIPFQRRGIPDVGPSGALTDPATSKAATTLTEKPVTIKTEPEDFSFRPETKAPSPAQQLIMSAPSEVSRDLVEHLMKLWQSKGAEASKEMQPLLNELIDQARVHWGKEDKSLQAEMSDLRSAQQALQVTDEAPVARLRGPQDAGPSSAGTAGPDGPPPPGQLDTLASRIAQSQMQLDLLKSQVALRQRMNAMHAQRDDVNRWILAMIKEFDIQGKPQRVGP